MFSKTIFVLAVVCAVNASVLTVNVFDDDPDTEIASNPKICDFQECDQRCRRLMFRGGACVKGRCKCDNFLNAEEDVSEEEPSDLEDLVSLKDDEPDIEFASKPKKCKLRSCEKRCRKHKFSGGACIDGRCMCDNFLNAEDVDSENSVSDPENLLSDLENSVLQQVIDDPETEVKAGPGRCNIKVCDWLCRWLNKTNGSCVNGRCKCEKSAIAEENLDIDVPTSPRRCSNRACNEFCRSGYFISGACVGGRCKCENSKEQDEISEISVSNFEDSILQDDLETEVETKKDDCNPQECNQRCRRLKFPGGACVKGRCKCDNFLNAEDAVTESNVEESVASRACNNKRCNQICRKQKFRGGACVGANCYCNKFLSLLDDTMTDSMETFSLRSCNSIACDDQCRRTGWHSGVCIKGECKCDYFRNTEADAVPVNSLSNLDDSLTPKRCTHDACTALCRKHQFREGVCNGARCRCSNYSPTPKDAWNDFDEPILLDDNFLTENSLSIEDAIDENAALNARRVCRLTKCNRTCTRRGYENATCVKGRCKCHNVTKTPLPVSELSEDQVERDCNKQACDQLCRSLKFHGGACVKGRCKCDNYFGTEDASPPSVVTSDENEESNDILRTN